MSSGGEDFYFNERDLLSPVIAKDDEVEFEPIPNRRSLRASFIQKIVPKRTFYNVGPVETFNNKATNHQPGEPAEYFQHCVEKTLDDGKTYLLVPLSEISQHYDIPITHFLKDELLDILNTLQKQHGYPILLTL